MILTMDVGNTNIKCALFDGEAMKLYLRISTDRYKTNDEYAGLLLPLLEREGYSSSDIEGAIFSSVVPEINFTLAHMAERYFKVKPMEVRHTMDLGIGIKYDNPAALGADRIANAVAVKHYYGCPSIYIDFGTATTFGVLSPNGDFIGGAICPGLKMSVDALSEKSSRLPRVELNAPGRVIATNTVENLQSGLISGHVGQVEYIVGQMKKEMGASSVKVVATGGMARLIESRSDAIDVYDGELTLNGIRLIYERNKGK